MDRTPQPLRDYDELRNCGDEGHHASQQGVKARQEEILVVAEADAIVDPWAMVVQP
eukprot:CAMPEP_0115189672 /NCGR_PEP_ID=MMETSP0270-20121206/11635_1 /TAXON_ID=71861 /ORGANISM="Scrippsiella trochoidea, Strain CCMP3099" /LENGTH=55 /DNA_ID=CAMNT_0002602869 /DNA_START=633 /DNA_END=800 /DNA_ORIENTATION=+